MGTHLPTKEALLHAVDKLSYDGRVKYATRIGCTHRNNPQLRALVDELFKHPEPQDLEMEAEEGFLEILPAQHTSIAKYYSEDQLALYIAAAAGMIDVMQERLQSPSIFFDQLVVSKFVGMKSVSNKSYLASDEQVRDAIVKAVPARRKLLLQECIQARRLSVIALAIPALEGLHSFSHADLAHYIHACPSAKLCQFLEASKFVDFGQSWEKIIKFHYIAVFDLLERDLAANKAQDRKNVWCNWRTWMLTGEKEIVKDKVKVNKLFDVIEKYPPLAPTNCCASLCALVAMPDIIHNNLIQLQSVIPDRLVEYLIKYKFQYNMRFDSSIKLSYELQNMLLKSVMYNEYFVITAISNLAHAWNTHQILKVAQMVAKSFKEHNNFKQPMLAFIKQLSIRLSKCHTKLISPSPPSKPEQVLADVEKYRKAIFTIMDLYYSTVENYAIKYVKEDTAKLQTKLKLITELVSTINEDPRFMESLVARIKPTMDALQQGPKNLTPEATSTLRTSKALIETFLLAVCRNLSKHKVSYTQEEADFAKKVMTECFQYLTTICGPSSLTQLLNINAALTVRFFLNEFNFLPHYHFLPKSQQEAVFKSLEKDQIFDLAQSKPETLFGILDPLPLAITNAHVNALLTTPKAVSIETRNRLVAYQDITSPGVRSSLQKAADSGSSTGRIAAIQTLVQATNRSKDLRQITQTLTFICAKIKNESQANRVAVLECLSFSLFPPGVDQEQFSLWYNMLEDCFAASDIDEGVYLRESFEAHPVFKNFHSIATECIEHSLQPIIDKSSKQASKQSAIRMLEFGAELLWRMNVFRFGARQAAEKYIIPFKQRYLSEPIEQITLDQMRALVSAYCRIYEKILSNTVTLWKTLRADVFAKFIKYKPQCFPDIPELCNVARLNIERVLSTSKDQDGLHIIDSSDRIMRLVEPIVYQDYSVGDWRGVVLELVDTIMHSRQAPFVVEKWIQWKEHNAKGPKRLLECRKQYIEELLGISPSAIYLQFVWRHLVLRRQDKLDQFIGQKSSFRGVFYFEPETRKFNRSCLKTPETRRTGGRRRNNLHEPKRSIYQIVGHCLNNQSSQVIIERETELSIQKGLQGISRELWDDEDFFCLEACYGLHRLLPRQANLLAKDWMAQALSKDRAMPYRVKAMARWTIMPTIGYSDIVTLLNEQESPNHEPLGVTLIETLLRGVTRNDEPNATLRFLLSPKFLASDRSRVSIYAISQAIPYLPAEAGLFDLLKLCLRGKRRHILKVTAHKEIIRLLLASPTKPQLDTVMNEWNRSELHRDVRIAILSNALNFVTVQNQKKELEEFGFNILEKAAMLDMMEIQVILLASASMVPLNCNAGSKMFSNDSVLEHLLATTHLNIPKQHNERFKRMLMSIGTSATNTDVRFIAAWVIAQWNQPLEAAKYVANYLLESISLLNSELPSDHELFHNRWKLLTQFLITLCTPPSAAGMCRIDFVAEICKKLMVLGPKERFQRKQLLNAVDQFLQSVPIYDPTVLHKKDRPASELALQATVKQYCGELFASTMFQRVAGKKNIQEIIDFANLHPMQAENAILCCLRSFSQLMSQISREEKALQYNTTAPRNKLYLLYKLAFNGIQNDCYTAKSHPRRTLGIWEKVFLLGGNASIEYDKPFYGTASFSCESIYQQIVRSITANPRKCTRITPRLVLTIIGLIPFILVLELCCFILRVTPAKKMSIGDTICNKAAEVRDWKKLPEFETYQTFHCQYIIRNISRRLLAVLKGNTQDAFAEQIGSLMLRRNIEIIVAGEDSVCKEIAHTLIDTTDDSYAIIPTMIEKLNEAQKYGYAVDLITEILQRSVNDSSSAYKTRARKIGLDILQKTPMFYGKRISELFYFLELVASLPSSEPDHTSKVTRAVLNLVRETCFLRSAKRDGSTCPSPVAKKLIRYYIDKYLRDPKEGETEFGTPQYITRAVVIQFVQYHPKWLIDYAKKSIKPLVSHLINESTQVVPYQIVSEMQFKEPLNILNSDGLTFISDIIYGNLQPDLTISDTKRLDAALDLIVRHPCFIIQSPSDIFFVLNWIISLYRTDTESTLQRIGTLKRALTSQGLLDYINYDKKERIASLVDFLSDLIDPNNIEYEDHEEETLLQLRHVSCSLAYETVKFFGNSLSKKLGKLSTKQTETHFWRAEIIAVLYKLEEVDDPIVRGLAMMTETVVQK